MSHKFLTIALLAIFLTTIVGGYEIASSYMGSVTSYAGTISPSPSYVYPSPVPQSYTPPSPSYGYYVASQPTPSIAPSYESRPQTTASQTYTLASRQESAANNFVNSEPNYEAPRTETRASSFSLMSLRTANSPSTESEQLNAAQSAQAAPLPARTIPSRTYTVSTTQSGVVLASAVTPTITNPTPTISSNTYTNNMELINSSTCNDSDNGIFSEQKGTVTLSGTAPVEDYCNGAGQVVEYFCDSQKTYDSFKIGCPLGCSNGACTEYDLPQRSEVSKYPEPEKSNACLPTEAAKKTQSTTSTSATFGAQKIAIILSKAPGEANPNIADLEKVMQYADDYYQTVSGHQVSLEWDVYGWYELASRPGSTYNQLLKFADADIDYTQYDAVISVDSRNNMLLTVGVGRQTRTTNDGKAQVGIIHVRPDVFEDERHTSLRRGVVHEIGHGVFGFGHANILDCGDVSVASLDNCSVGGYGDRFDIMGSPNIGQVNSIFKEYMGWIEPEIVFSPGIYRIDASELMEGVSALKIPKKDSSGNFDDYYYLEYRTSRDYDKELMSQVDSDNGLQVRFWKPKLYEENDTFLLDLSPLGELTGLINAYHIALNNGKTFVDPNGLSIKVTDMDSDSLEVEVSCA